MSTRSTIYLVQVDFGEFPLTADLFNLQEGLVFRCPDARTRSCPAPKVKAAANCIRLSDEVTAEFDEFFRQTAAAEADLRR
jgi:hypothetical protein